MPKFVEWVNPDLDYQITEEEINLLLQIRLAKSVWRYLQETLKINFGLRTKVLLELKNQPKIDVSKVNLYAQKGKVKEKFETFLNEGSFETYIDLQRELNILGEKLNL